MNEEEKNVFWAETYGKGYEAGNRDGIKATLFWIVVLVVVPIVGKAFGAW